MRLSVRLRRDDDDDHRHHPPSSPSSPSNLFARLSPRTARKLHSLAVMDLRRERGRGVCDDDDDDDDGGRCWTVSPELGGACESGVEFLPLALSPVEASATRDRGGEEIRGGVGGTETVYASYNGGSIVADLEEEGRVDDEDGTDGFIELHPSLLASFSFRLEASVVNVRPLHAVRAAAAVTIEPLTPEDWEAMEVHSAFLEGAEGGLLSQVSVVYPGQVLQLRLGRNHDAARARVLEDGFEGPLATEEKANSAVDSDGEGEIGVECDDDDGEGSWSSEWSSCASSSDDDSASLMDVARDEECTAAAVVDRGCRGTSRRGHLHECLRLVANTEVVVVPKPRPPPPRTSSEEEEDDETMPSFEPSAPLRVHPSAEDFDATLEFRSTVDGIHRRPPPPPPPRSPPPSEARAHPRTLSDLVPGWKECRRRSSGGDDDLLPGGSAVAVVWKAPRCPYGETLRFDGGDRSDSAEVGMTTIRASEDVPYGHVVVVTGWGAGF